MGDHSFTTPKAGAYQAQDGEDLWLDGYFGGKQHGFFVEVGAYDGIVLSNTYFFGQAGWRGILVEPNPSKARLCRANRPESRVFECAAVAPETPADVELLDVLDGEVYSTLVPSEFNLERLREFGLSSRNVCVPARTLDSILEEAAAPAIDFVSIDVEGAELGVLQGFDIARWHPRLVMIECATARSPAIRRYFVRNGYAYLRSVGFNDVYAPASASVPFGDRQAVAATIDMVRYRARKTLPAARQRARIRSRLRARGLLK
jgi:FkbM family methyltransferase